MASSISYTDKIGGELIPIFFDLLKEEKHEFGANVTEHPIETGASIADHKRAKPRAVTLQAMVSNHPLSVPKSHADGVRGGVSNMTVGYPVKGSLPIGIPLVGSLLASSGLLDTTEEVTIKALQFDSEFDRVASVLEDLIMIAEGGYLCTIETSLRTYEDMTVTSVAAPRTAKDGNSVTFSIECHEVRFAETQTVKAPTTAPGAKKKQAGPKPAAEANAENESLLHKGASSALGALGG